MARILKPKFVKRAGAWCVTVFAGGKQEVKWFSTEKEAWKFIEKEQGEIKG